LNNLSYIATRDPVGEDKIPFIEVESGLGITYRELRVRALNFAGHLAERGVVAGSRVILHLYNSIDAIVAHLAVQHLGAISCFVDALVQPKSLGHYVGTTACRLMITHGDPASLDPEARSATLLLAASEITPLSNTPPARPAPPEAHDFAADDPCYVYFTSGTTSLPKGVVLTARNHAAFTAICDRYWRPVDEDSRHLGFVPFSHGFGTIFLVPLALRTSSTLFIMRAFHPLKVLEAVERHGITHMYGVPSHYQQLLRMGPAAEVVLQRLRMAFCAAAKLEHSLMLDWEKATGVRLCEGYGLIETCCGVTWRVDSPSLGTGHMGPCPDRDLVEIGILDERDQLVPAEVVGQIAVKGPSVMQGYLGDPAGTRNVMANGWFKTGDEGYVSAGNQLFLTGRIKDIINIAGIKVSPFEVEAVLDQHPAVAQSAVVSASDPLYGEVVKAFVRLRPEQSVTERDLIRFASSHLINFQVPKSVSFVDTFPLTNMGKLDRKQLRAR
jgi:long-chain acyl-CoA synthetase